jgi:putative membrane protein
LLLGGAARAADSPSSADVLGKLHHSNEKEIAMGKLAEKNGQSKDVKGFGKTLVHDHTAADRKVAALAKAEKVELKTDDMSGEDMSSLGSGADFDAKFAQAMLDDHKKDLSEVTEARDGTSDPKLKKLLTGLVPVLQKHEDTAQKIVNAHGEATN